MKKFLLVIIALIVPIISYGQSTISRKNESVKHKSTNKKTTNKKVYNSKSNIKQAKIPEILKKTVTVNGVSFDMIFVEQGCFLYGSDNHSASHFSKETVESFYIGETEVTQKLWLAIMDSNPSKHKGAQFPVENITMLEITKFIEKLNFETGLEFRLPTAIEWEYAAKGGKYSLTKDKCVNESDNLESVGWFKENSNGKTHSVKELMPNEIGIYDMMGNVNERTITRSEYKFERAPLSSLPDGINFIIKGSSIDYGKDFYKVWSEPHFPDTWNSETIGFRLLLTD